MSADPLDDAEGTDEDLADLLRFLLVRMREWQSKLLASPRHGFNDLFKL